MPAVAVAAFVAATFISPTPAAADTARIWPNGSAITVAFIDPPSQRTIDHTLRHARDWEQYANVRFVHVADLLAADVRISFVAGGSWSQVGTDARAAAQGQPTMNIGTPASSMFFAFTVRHEFGHVLGLVHEEQSPNARIPWDVAAVEADIGDVWRLVREYNPVLVYSKDETRATGYDQRSIMHGRIPVHWVTDVRFAHEWVNHGISALDAQLVSELYPPTVAGQRGRRCVPDLEMIAR